MDKVKLTQNDIDKGWFYTESPAVNMPACWIFVRWESGSAMLDSDKIKDFVKLNRLRKLNGSQMFRRKGIKR